jgi:anti-sigma factor RsiW
VSICAHIQGELHALLDHELDIAARSEVLGHLDICRSCQEEYEAHRQLKALLAEHLADREAPERLWCAIIQRIEDGERSEASVRRGWRRATPRVPARAAAIVLATLMVAGGAVVVSHSEYLSRSTARPASLIDEIIGDHRDSMSKGTGPADIRSGDLLTVLAGLRLQGRLPESTTALPRETAQLLGGSFCHFRPTTGIRLTYRVGEGRLVSFYQLRRPPHVGGPRSTAHREYLEVLDEDKPHLILWGDDHMLYAIVSAAPVDELRGLVSRL